MQELKKIQSRNYVPREFRGKLQAQLSKVFKNDDGSYSFLFRIIEAGTYQGMWTRIYLFLDNPRRLDYFTRLYKEYGVDFSEDTIESLVGRQFELRYSNGYKENGHQDIWINKASADVIPMVSVNINGNTCLARFDGKSSGLNVGAGVGFKLWMALKIWAQQQLALRGWPAFGRFEYPKEIYVNFSE